MPTLIRPPAAPEGGQDYPQLKDQLGHVVILTPMEEKTITTERGTAEVTNCVCLSWDETTKKVQDVGTVTVFWKAVRAQLHDAVGTDAYVIGRLMMHGRRFELDPVEDSVMEAIGAQLL